MKIKLVCVGAVKSPQVRDMVADYERRLAHYFPYARVDVADVRAGSATAERVKEAEGAKILAEVGGGDRLVLLDERGREYTSREFSEMLARAMHELPRALVFAIGGPFGFSEAVYKRADAKVSLSRMTFPHELARLFFVEQLYRCGTILKGESYHHD